MINRAPTTTLIGALAIALVACPENKAPQSTTREQPASPASQAATSQPSAAGETIHEHELPKVPKDGKGTSPETRDQMDPDGVMRRGTALSDAKAIPVSEAIAGVDKLAGTTVKLSGTIQDVCERRGCWFVVRGEKPADQVRVVAKDYGFFVARSALGKPVTIEGQLEVKTVEPALAQHMEDERARAANEEKKKITEPQREVTITAAAVEIRGKS